ncbi:MAG: flagellar biosynthesis regulator FlaF [Parvularculaceae bacterium]
MFEAALAKDGYASSVETTASPRNMEYQVFARVTRRLANAGDGSLPQFTELAEALHDNIRLWTVVAADVASERNSLSKDLRSKLFYLFEFTRKHSAKVLDGEADADVLVDINMSVMRGLRGELDQGGEE